MVVGLILAACPQRGAERANENGGTSPVTGGRLVFGVIGEPSTLDPYSPKATDLTYALVRPIYPSLYRFRPDGTTVPQLAASLTEVGRGVRIRLVQTSWSDGRPITARDVAASVRRAPPLSGLARIDRIRIVGPRTFDLYGGVAAWERTLATLAFVLPDGRARRVSGGPFVLRRYRRGFEIVYERNEQWISEPAHLDRITVRFVERTSILLQLLRRGELDAAAPLSTVNLEERLDTFGMNHADALGWERIYLDFEGAPFAQSQRRWIVQTVNRASLEEGLVRRDGRVSDTLHPSPGTRGADGAWRSVRGAIKPPSDRVQLAAPTGDELIELIQRALQLQLLRADVESDLVTTDAARFYGSWEQRDPMEVAIRRAAGAPGLEDRPGSGPHLNAFPLFHVETVLSWNDDIHGLVPNPTFEGPLWNAEQWWVRK